MVVHGGEMTDAGVMRRMLGNLLLVLLALAVSAGMIEIAARLFVAVPKPYALTANAYVHDRRGFWTITPGLETELDNGADFTGRPVNVDEIGARILPCQEGAAAERRVFLVGDSQTFGWGLADGETWAAGLQCALAERQPGRFRVYDLGVPGTQADQYWARGRAQVAAAVRPGDVVVISPTWNDLITFYMGKKFVDAALAEVGLARAANNGVKPAESVPPADAAAAAAGPALQLTEPRVYLDPPTWRYKLYRDYGIFVPSFASVQAFGDTMVHVSAAFGIAWSRARLIYYRFRPVDSFANKVDPTAFANNFYTLKALATLLQRKGAKVLIQLLPNRLFFDDFYYASYSRNGAAFPARDYMGHVAKPFCSALGLSCVNRFEDLKTSRRDAHTFAFDGHYNAAGARRIATALAADVLKLEATPQ